MRFPPGLVAGVKVLAWLLGGVLLVCFLIKYPWPETLNALRRADFAWLLAAGLVNLTSLVWKGWAWQLLLNARTPFSWWAAQEANLIGSAVNSISMSLAGEAARLNHAVSRSAAPLASVTASIVWARGVEGLGLALVLSAGPILFPVQPVVAWASLGALTGLVLFLALLLAPRYFAGSRFVPLRLRPFLEITNGAGGTCLLAPTALALANWAAQWATFHFVLTSFQRSTPPAASFTALIVVNLAGILRLTPANLGITQVAVVFALTPFGFSPETSLASGLAIQAVQVPPVLGLGMFFIGIRGLAGGCGLRRPAAFELPRSELPESGASG